MRGPGRQLQRAGRLLVERVRRSGGDHDDQDPADEPEEAHCVGKSLAALAPVKTFLASNARFGRGVYVRTARADGFRARYCSSIHA